tara:strand:- start:2735 stop:3745 length:1011 start_codon:yes stop_codon:yes gene_type:complete
MSNMHSSSFPSLRLRRGRSSQWIRNLLNENKLTSDDLIWPIFICEGKNKKDEISSMPNVYRYSIDQLDEISETANELGINLVALFPYIPEEKKTEGGEESINSKNLVCKALKKIKSQKNNFGVMCDVALDPYTSHGHDGLVNHEGEILNDETNSLLVKQALLFAEHGADVIAPSDMMDGRIGKIRNKLEDEKFYNTIILSYSAKYASKMYSPFRDAVGSSSKLKTDKKTYQMNIANSDEALREIAMDIKEGADIVMVKPGISYLDIISKIKSEFNFPTFAYQVSGEYSMIKVAANKGFIDEEEIVFEQLTAFKRAGADAILSYFAPEVARKLKSEN